MRSIRLALWVATAFAFGLVVLRVAIHFQDPIRPQPNFMLKGPAATEPILVGSVSTVSAEWPRSLFSQARMTADIHAVEHKVSEAPAETKLPILVGILFGDRHRMALMSHDGKLRRVRENESIGPWVLREIGRRSAMVRRGNSIKVLSLDASDRLSHSEQ